MEICTRSTQPMNYQILVKCTDKKADIPVPLRAVGLRAPHPRAGNVTRGYARSVMAGRRGESASQEGAVPRPLTLALTLTTRRAAGRATGGRPLQTGPGALENLSATPPDLQVTGYDTWS